MHAFATVKVSYFGSVSNRNLCNFTVVEPDIKRKKSRHMQLQSWSSRVVSEVYYSHPQRIVKSPFLIDYCCKADRQFHLLVRDLLEKVLALKKLRNVHWQRIKSNVCAGNTYVNVTAITTMSLENSLEGMLLICFVLICLFLRLCWLLHILTTVC